MVAHQLPKLSELSHVRRRVTLWSGGLKSFPLCLLHGDGLLPTAVVAVAPRAVVHPADERALALWGAIQWTFSISEGFGDS